MLVPIAVGWEGLPRLGLPGTAWAAILALGLGCTSAAIGLWNWGLRLYPAGNASVFLNIEPLVGALLGSLVLGDPLYPTTIAGGVLIIGAAVVISWLSAKRSSAK